MAFMLVVKREDKFQEATYSGLEGYVVKCKGPWGLDRHQLGGVAAA